MSRNKTAAPSADLSGTGTTADVLRAARALYEANPSHTFTYPMGDLQCPIKALNRVAGAFNSGAAKQTFREANGIGGLADFNATHDTPTVLAAFDKAIAAAEARS